MFFVNVRTIESFYIVVSLSISNNRAPVHGTWSTMIHFDFVWKLTIWKLYAKLFWLFKPTRSISMSDHPFMISLIIIIIFKISHLFDDNSNKFDWFKFNLTSWFNKTTHFVFHYDIWLSQYYNNLCSCIFLHWFWIISKTTRSSWSVLTDGTSSRL